MSHTITAGKHMPVWKAVVADMGGYSTLIYLDADARMDTFQAADGSNQTRLNLVQRRLLQSRPEWRRADQ